jgi:PAS domain S-box-containing protein
VERRILVVEDSPTQAEHLRLLLEGAGYRVELAGSGREALERLEAVRPDLIVSDVVMPEMDGYALCHAVKASEATRRIPFVFLTERRTALDILRGLELGADNFLTKPFDDALLVERVERIFHNLALREHGQLEVEVTLRVAGREIGISADKQQIIELLFSTFEEMCTINASLIAAQRTIEDYARTLEAQVEMRTRELRSLFDRVPLGLFRSTPAGRLVDANPALVSMLGYASREALFAVHVADLYADPDDRERWRATIEREGTVRNYEVRLKRADGTLIWVLENAHAARDPDGRLVYFEGALEDITDRRRAEETLRQSEKLAAMGQLLAGVAHELNNPLSVVLGQTALLHRTAASGSVLARAEKIALAAERCARIVKNFLALARQRPPERSRVQLNAVVNEAVELLAYVLRVDGVETRLELAEDLPELWADPHQLHQVVLNLISNAQQALHASPPPRRITLATRFDAAPARVVLVVADTGPGIPPAIRSRIFEPFFTTKPPGQGTGLGLSLCRGIVESHGGTLELDSRPGPGAVFRIGLPVVEPPTEPERTAVEIPTPVRSHAILVVDDETEVAQVLADILAADGHEVDTAPDGAAALEKLGRRPYDLVLSDLRMPGLGGPDFHREAERRHPGIGQRFIFLTGDTLSPDAAQFIERVRAPSVSKPFEIAEVRRAVQAALQRAGR